MTANEAADLISTTINLDVNRDKDKVFRLLTLVNNKAWKEGSWWGMNKHFHVEVKKDLDGYYYFIAPNGYNILQAANFNGQPVGIKDKWFQFHKNGYGTIEKECCGANWVRDIQDMGEVPVIVQPTTPTTEFVKIGARTVGHEQDPVKVYINGEDINGHRVTTYKKDEDGDIEPIIGATLAVNEEVRIIDNINWGRIDSITKDQSLNAVEVYAIHCDGSMQILTRLDPEETKSRLRKYLVPDDCGIACVHGIFKVSKPDPILYGTQKMIIEDEEALLSLSISMDYLFNKKAPEESLPYTVNGVKSLEDDNREHESPSSQSIQVEGVEDYGFLENSNY